MKKKALSLILEALPVMIYLLVVGSYINRLEGSSLVCITAIMVGLAIISAKGIETIITRHKGVKTEEDEFVVKSLCLCLNVPIFYMAFKMVEYISKKPETTVRLIMLSISFAIFHSVMSHITDALVYHKSIFPTAFEEDEYNEDDY